MRTSYTYATIASLALVLVATPVFAEETAVPTKGTTAVTTPLHTSTPAPTGKTLEQRIAEWRAKFAIKKASATAQSIQQSIEKRELGTKLQDVDALCVQKAVDTREVAIQKAWTALNTSLSDALIVRQKALYDAWGLSDVSARATALKSAWTAWKDAHKSIFTTLKTNRTAIWNAYKTTMKNECKAVVPKEEKLNGDMNGSVSL